MNMCIWVGTDSGIMMIVGQQMTDVLGWKCVSCAWCDFLKNLLEVAPNVKQNQSIIGGNVVKDIYENLF